MDEQLSALKQASETKQHEKYNRKKLCAFSRMVSN